jgi:hypothetical protein
VFSFHRVFSVGGNLAVFLRARDFVFAAVGEAAGSFSWSVFPSCAAEAYSIVWPAQAEASPRVPACSSSCSGYFVSSSHISVLLPCAPFSSDVRNRVPSPLLSV